MLTIDIDTSKLEREWADARAQLGRDMAGAVRDATRAGATDARATKRFQRRSGDLEDSIDGHTIASGADFTDGVVEATDWKATLLNDGTDPHTIAAKGDKPLRFRGRDGNWVSKWSVQHPGTAADGFMDRGEEKAREVLQREMDAAVSRMADRMNR